ncbi:hypothetical protein FSHL1_010946 [Fusarium sambucinum]
MDCNPDYENATWAFYRFVPSKEANIVFVVLFAITTLLHVLQLWRTRTWYLIPLVVGGVCEVIGYIGRVLNTNEEPGCWTMGPYIMQSVLILIAPALFAASIYMILGRIILLTDGEHHSLIPRKWLTKLFVFGDVASFMLQSSGMKQVEGFTSEVWVFVFDGMLMLLVLVWMNWFHPGEIGLLIRGEESITNGLELMKLGGSGRRSRVDTMESLGSGSHLRDVEER